MLLDHQEKFSIGYVTWADANGHNNVSHTFSHRPYTVLTAGLIVQDDEQGVTIVQDFSEEGTLREIKFIPRVNILETKVLLKDAVSRQPQLVMFPTAAAPKRKAKRRG